MLTLAEQCRIDNQEANWNAPDSWIEIRDSCTERLRTMGAYSATRGHDSNESLGLSFVDFGFSDKPLGAGQWGRGSGQYLRAIAKLRGVHELV